MLLNIISLGNVKVNDVLYFFIYFMSKRRVIGKNRNISESKREAKEIVKWMNISSVVKEKER